MRRVPEPHERAVARAVAHSKTGVRKGCSRGCGPIANDTSADTFVPGCWGATPDATRHFKSCVNTMVDSRGRWRTSVRAAENP
jgi:hypothetical protein